MSTIRAFYKRHNLVKMIKLWRSLHDSAERPYWHCTWITQEFLLARNITVHCGKQASHQTRSQKVLSVSPTHPRLCGLNLNFLGMRTLWTEILESFVSITKAGNHLCVLLFYTGEKQDFTAVMPFITQRNSTPLGVPTLAIRYMPYCLWRQDPP